MKKLIVTFGMFLAGMGLGYSQSSAASAPTQTAPPKMDASARADKMVEKWKQVCNLTPDQAAKVKPMALTFAKTIEANREKYANDQDGMRTASMKARDNLMAQLKTVLAPEQMEKIQGNHPPQNGAQQPGTAK